MKHLLVFVLSIAAAVAADNNAAGMTRDQHQKAAEQHRMRAEDYAAKAARHEAAAQRIKANRGYNAMQYKWPAMALGAENRERDLAMQARRNEAEARERLAFHSQLAAAE